MNRTREQILVDLNKAAHGPFGLRSLAMTLRKSSALILELREDGITWEQITELLSETGHSASSETVRRTFTRIRSSSASAQRSAPVTPEADTELMVKVFAEPPPSAVLTRAGVTERATGPPSRSGPLPGTQYDPGLKAGESLLDALKKLKEIDK
ncbi:hypothetical protein [Devosia indica]